VTMEFGYGYTTVVILAVLCMGLILNRFTGRERELNVLIEYTLSIWTVSVAKIW